jgi:hypothetical protein
MLAARRRRKRSPIAGEGTALFFETAARAGVILRARAVH